MSRNSTTQRDVTDYLPAPPASMRRYLELVGPAGLIWECFGCGEFWSPA